ncbi:MAG: tRNA (adenosine(37)-N6)-dimethylallyltransferase MiaA [Sphaerochaetaceae bacterium]|nr:tRNA (adenosine(37)-N6)-dimethylallyltransferase MiaA [Sphaerochaetaceae bacterium]
MMKLSIQLVKNKSKKTVVFLFGPTAVGKTDLISKVFFRNFEVVNTDSVQIYKHLDIGSAKADEKERQLVFHHLLDIRDPWQDFSVGEFIKEADDACKKIWEKGKIPLLSGGTAFYFKHFMYGLSKAPKSNSEIRNKIKIQIENEGLEKSFERLKSIDSLAVLRIHPNDSYRISRALEIYEATGKPLSSFALGTELRNNLDIHTIGLIRDRNVLNERIRKRVEIMFSEGLQMEIKKLYELGAVKEWPAMKAIGYKEFFVPVKVANPLNMSDEQIKEIKERISMNSIHYAKRQRTFFKSFSDVNWVEPDNIDEVEKLLNSWNLL